MDKDRPYQVKTHLETRIGRFDIIQDVIEIDGIEYPYSYNKVNDCVCILPIYNNEIILIKQYRHVFNKWFLEIPAGGVENTDVLDTAKRELLEETGYSSTNIELISSMPVSQGTSTAIAHLFLARDLEYVGGDLEPTEFIEVVKVRIDEFDEMIRDGRFSHMVGITLWHLCKDRITESI